MKTDSDLARFMDAALRQHANRVLNGNVTPYRKFLTGATSVNVTMTLAGNEIEVKETETLEKRTPAPIEPIKPKRKHIEE